jgi:hypothetical protein
MLALLGVMTWGLTAQAEHANIRLTVFRMGGESGAKQAEVDARADQEPPAGGVNARPLFKAKAGEPLVLQFIYENTYPHGVTKDVRIRYFVVREEKAGQKALPDLKSGVVTDGQWNLNLKPKGKVGARVAFTVREPGVYLLRVDSFHTNSDHEHFAAIDLQVE